MLYDGDGNTVGGAERYVLELARHMAAVTPTRLVSFGEQPAHTHTGDLEVRILSRPWYVRGQRSNPMTSIQTKLG